MSFLLMLQNGFLMFFYRHLFRHTFADHDVHWGDVFLGSEVRGLQCGLNGAQGGPAALPGHRHADPA